MNNKEKEAANLRGVRAERWKGWSKGRAKEMLCNCAWFKITLKIIIIEFKNKKNCKEKKVERSLSLNGSK